MNEYMNKFDTFCTDLFVKKFPALPENIKDSLAKFAPIGAILLVVLALPFVLAGLGISALFAPVGIWSWAYRHSSGGMLALILSTISLILQGIAIGPLFARSIKGWNFLLYSVLVSTVSGLVIFDMGNLVWMLIEVYILYQIKDRYK